ncbi:unnamed protein product [Chrysoparadoxa australica]
MAEVPNHRASEKELEDNRIPIHWRDNCAALLIPLNKCRKDNFFRMDRCEHERHIYEKCQYTDWKARKAILEEKTM